MNFDPKKNMAISLGLPCAGAGHLPGPRLLLGRLSGPLQLLWHQLEVHAQAAGQGVRTRGDGDGQGTMVNEL